MKIVEDTKISKSLNLPANTSMDELRDLICTACREWATTQANFDGGYVSEVYSEEVIFCMWLEEVGSKYYRLTWKNEGRVVTVSDPVEVVRATTFVAIAKAAEIAEVVRVPPASRPSIFQSLVAPKD